MIGGRRTLGASRLKGYRAGECRLVRSRARSTNLMTKRSFAGSVPRRATVTLSFERGGVDRAGSALATHRENIRTRPFSALTSFAAVEPAGSNARPTRLITMMGVNTH